jgi:hypothetical protein
MLRATQPKLLPVAPCVLLGVVLMLSGCGATTPRALSGGADSRPQGHPGAVLVRIGGRTITASVYNHWMAVGEATLQPPKPSGPLPSPLAYQPPRFAVCVAHARITEPKPKETQLVAQCRATYEGIQRRILNFLITGYWLREAAAESHLVVNATEVRRKFYEERRANYPTVASFRRLQEASRQTVPDLEFAVERQMLSARLLVAFGKAHPRMKSEAATIAAFNASIKSKWEPQTTCSSGYVVPDCKEYHPPER